RVESLQQIRQTARHAVIDAQFIDHGALPCNHRWQHASPSAGRQDVKSENGARKMRPIVLLRGVLVVLLVIGSPLYAQHSADPQALAAFADRTGLRDVRGFVETVQTLRNTGHLPERYVTKQTAQS